MLKLRIYICNNRGIALPLVVVMIFVLTLFGTALWQYSMADTAQVTRDVRRMQAHYEARSGADAMAEHIIKNPRDVVDIIAETNAATGSYATGSVGNGSFNIEVTGDPNNVVYINAIGRVGAVENSVSLALPRLSGTAIFNRAIHQLSDEDLNLWNMYVNGDVESGGDVTVRENRFIGEIYDFSDSYYPEALFPNLNWRATPAVGADGNLHIEGNYEYTSITTQPGVDTIFLTNGNAIKVVVDNIDVKGDIIVDPGVSGTGRLELYVRTSANLQTPNEYNDDPWRFIVYMPPNSTFTIQANGDFNGYLYAPYSKVYIQSDQSTINGSIIAYEIYRNDNETSGPNGRVNHVTLEQWVDIFGSIYAYRRGYWSN